MEDVRITPKQLKEIRHALGGKIKKDAYRNHYYINGECESWDELVKIGFATKQDMGDSSMICYNVTEKAIEALQE